MHTPHSYMPVHQHMKGSPTPLHQVSHLQTRQNPHPQFSQLPPYMSLHSPARVSSPHPQRLFPLPCTLAQENWGSPSALRASVEPHPRAGWRQGELGEQGPGTESNCLCFSLQKERAEEGGAPVAFRKGGGGGELGSPPILSLWQRDWEDIRNCGILGAPVVTDVTGLPVGGLV